MKTVLLLFLLTSFSIASGQIVINEISAANGDQIFDPDFFEFAGWIELYNKGNSQTDVSGYYLTDDDALKNKWRIPSGSVIPARGHLLIWCDDRNMKLHTNFNLDSDGEHVILSNPSLNSVDEIVFPKQYINISYGRAGDGAASVSYLEEATPGKKNVTSTGMIRVEGPEFSLPAGRYSTGQSISFLHAQETSVRYTVDGSEPTLASTLYTAPINISKTATLKAKSFREGFIPSATETRTYFIKEHDFSLPTIALSTNPANLFDTKIGIYVEGNNGIAGYCREQAVNWNQDWDRHMVFEYFDKNGDKNFDQSLDIRIGGACSRNNPQKSLALKARDKYGSRLIDKRFFSSKEISKFGSLMLRNSGNDFWYTNFRDALMQSIIAEQMDVDYQAYQPSIVYINGSYWGIHNIREKVDGDYIEANFGVSAKDVDLLETYGNALEGTGEHYAMYLDSLQKIDRSEPAAFAFINRYIDVQEFINYLVAEIYYCNTDWPGNNVKFWRRRSDEGRYRWILWDMDFGFGLYQDQSFPTHPTLDFATDPDNTEWPNPSWSTLHLRLLLQNPEFKNKFIQTFTSALSTTFNPDKLIEKINSFQNNIKEEMPYHAQRWQLNLNNWNFEVERLRSFARQRNNYMRTYLGNFFGMSEQVRYSLSVSPLLSGSIRFNGISSTAVKDGFYYRSLPYEAYAEANPGFRFSHYTVRKKEATYISLVTRHANWKYSDEGQLPSVGWINADYDDTAWKSGAAELGYGEGDEATLVSYGPGPSKYITTYFRKTFTAEDTVGLSALSANILFDDGVVVYLNGQEVFRANMPNGTVDNSTLATISQAEETSYFPFSIPKGLLKPGPNVIAVELHQNSPESSDISFDLQLETVRSGAEVEYTTTEISLEDIANSDVIIQANFVPVIASTGLIINEVCAQNNWIEDIHGDTDDWIEIYNNGTEAIDVANYFITDDRSNRTKYKIPASENGETLVQPGSYKLLWADGDVNQGPLHLGFKLSAEGEEIGIYQMAGNSLETVDEITFAMEPGAATYSRIPNITGDFVLTSKATPLMENVFEVPTAVGEQVDSDIHVYPIPTRKSIIIKFAGAQIPFRMVNTNGQILKGGEVLPGEAIALDDIPAGIYIIIFQLNGRQVTKRVMKL